MMPQEIIPLTLHTMPSFHSCYVSEGDNLSFSSPLCRCCLMMSYFSLHCLCQCTVEVTTDTTMEINGHNHMLILSCRTQVLLVLVLSDLLLITREMTTHITTSLLSPLLWRSKVSGMCSQSGTRFVQQDMNFPGQSTNITALIS